MIDYAVEDPTRTMDESYAMVINRIHVEDPNYFIDVFHHAKLDIITE